MNANNHVTTAPFTFDAAGNETADAAGTYTWNAEGELKTAGGVTYTYDGDGRRAAKSNGKLYWYGSDGNVLNETDATGSVTNSAFSQYTYMNGRLVARRDQANAYYYFDDQIGSSRSLASVPAGTRTPTLCYEGDFYPYGAESVVTNTCPQNYKWTGKERDAETGNDDFDARYYSSTYGRFLSADWSAVPAPVPYANLTNPQTLNLYAIVRDNPESYADRDGHCIFGIDTAVCIVVGAAVALAATYYTFHHIRTELEKREEVEKKAFDRSMECAFGSGANCTERDLRGYDQERANTYKKGAQLAIEDAFPSAEPPSSLTGFIVDQAKAAAIDKIIKSAQAHEEEERQKHPSPHAPEGSIPRPQTQQQEQGQQPQQQLQQGLKHVCQQGSACT